MKYNAVYRHSALQLNFTDLQNKMKKINRLFTTQEKDCLNVKCTPCVLNFFTLTNTSIS